MYVGSPPPSQAPSKQDLAELHVRAKARPSVAVQQAASKMLQKHPQFDYKGTRNGASPRNRKKRQDKVETSFVSEQAPGDYYEPIKMTRHNFIVEDNRKDTGNRQEITTVSFGTGGNPSGAGTRDRGSQEGLKRRRGPDQQVAHPGTAVERFDEKRSSGQRHQQARSSRLDMS